VDALRLELAIRLLLLTAVITQPSPARNGGEAPLASSEYSAATLRYRLRRWGTGWFRGSAKGRGRQLAAAGTTRVHAFAWAP
jgi:hypothetical protein